MAGLCDCDCHKASVANRPDVPVDDTVETLAACSVCAWKHDQPPSIHTRRRRKDAGEGAES